MLHRIIHSFAASLILVASSLHADSTAVEASNGWINNLPPSVPMRAGYLQLNNNSDQAVRLVGVESSAFERVEIHETRMQDGVMKMQELDHINIPASGAAELKPGAMHLMMMNPKIDLNPGTEIPVTLHFNDGGVQQVSFKVKK